MKAVATVTGELFDLYNLIKADDAALSILKQEKAELLTPAEIDAKYEHMEELSEKEWANYWAIVCQRLALDPAGEYLIDQAGEVIQLPGPEKKAEPVAIYKRGLRWIV